MTDDWARLFQSAYPSRDWMVEPFEDRQQAGRALVAALRCYKGSDAIILAIPRGGVVVGYEVAVKLGLDLDVIVPRKIPAPQQEELAIGAVASWGNHESLIDERSVLYLGVSEEYIERQVQTQLEEVDRRLLAYRGATDPPNVAGRTVLLIDDGIATGYTTRAAAMALKNLKASRVVLGVPVGPPDTIGAMRQVVDEVVCLLTPDNFMAVGYWYRDFRQVSDQEVIDLLRRARSRKPT
jgi:putative phosphoribosyl transferase